MASEDRPDEGAADDGMADWAEALLEQKATESTGSNGPSGGVLAGDSPKPFSSFSGGGDAPINDINMVLDIPVQLSVELGRTKVPIKHILQLGQGSVVELERLAGELLDISVNGTLIARGEIVLVGERLGIRVSEIISPEQRLRNL